MNWEIELQPPMRRRKELRWRKCWNRVKRDWCLRQMFDPIIRRRWDETLPLLREQWLDRLALREYARQP